MADKPAKKSFGERFMAALLKAEDIGRKRADYELYKESLKELPVQSFTDMKTKVIKRRKSGNPIHIDPNLLGPGGKRRYSKILERMAQT